MSSLGKAVRRLADSRLIVTPRHLTYLAKRGDDPYPQWVVDRIAEQLVIQPRDRSKSFSGSSAGGCPRERVLSYLGKPPTDLTGEVPAETMAIYKDGKWRHLRWQADTLDSGIINEIEYSVPWLARRAVGTLDGLGVVPSDHAVETYRGALFGLEVKGINAFQYSRLVAEPLPSEKHLYQIHWYFLLSDIELFSVIYENKSTQQFHEWVLRPIPKYLHAVEQELNELNDYTDNRELPPMLNTCSIGKGKMWADCQYGGEGGTCVLARKWRMR